MRPGRIAEQERVHRPSQTRTVRHAAPTLRSCSRGRGRERGVRPAHECAARSSYRVWEPPSWLRPFRPPPRVAHQSPPLLFAPKCLARGRDESIVKDLVEAEQLVFSPPCPLTFGCPFLLRW